MAKLIQEKRGVQSIGVGLRILRALTVADAALSLTSVAKAAGVPSSSSHRYLTSFIKEGFVTQDSVSGRYELGPGIIRAGLAALRRADPVVVGLKTCEALAELTGRTAQLSIWTDAGPVIVSWRMGRVPVPTNLAVGSRLPLLKSATGRAFLAYIPPAVWKPMVIAEGGSVEYADRLRLETREMGYARVSGDLIPGLAAAATPLLDARGYPAAVVTLLGLRGELRKKDVQSLVERVKSSTAELGSAPKHTI